MWCLPGVSCNVFLDSLFLGDALLETYFKGGRPLILMGFKA